MNIVLGFGDVEKRQRKQVKDWIFQTLKTIYNNKKEDQFIFFSDEMIEDFKKEFKAYQKDLDDVYEENHAMAERPERYFRLSSYDCRVAFDYNTAFIKVGFWHINSKHPMSNDGMVLMEISETYTIMSEDFK